jgi:hypothetical protein
MTPAVPDLPRPGQDRSQRIALMMRRRAAAANHLPASLTTDNNDSACNWRVSSITRTGQLVTK